MVDFFPKVMKKGLLGNCFDQCCTDCTNDFNSLIRKSLSEQREYRNAAVKTGMDFLCFSPHLLYLFYIFYI